MKCSFVKYCKIRDTGFRVEMALSLSVYGSFDFEFLARVNTSAAHIPQYLREKQSQILLKYSANYLFSFHVFLWDFSDTFLILIKILKLTFNNLGRYKEGPLINVWGILFQSHYATNPRQWNHSNLFTSSTCIFSFCLQKVKTYICSLLWSYYTKESRRKVAK